MSPKRRTDSSANINAVVVREEEDPSPIFSVLGRYWITNSLSGLSHMRMSDGKKRRRFWMLVRLSIDN